MRFLPSRPLLLPRRYTGAAVREPVNDTSVTAGPDSCLWSIAAEHLGPAATDWEIAHEWPRWHRANRSILGAEPGGLRPGTILRPPPDRAGQG